MRRRIIFILSLFQIFLLVNLVVAQSYNIRDEKSSINLELNKISKKIIKSGLNLLVGFFSIKQIGFVSAVGCCGKTNDGAFCQEVDSGSECDSSFGYSPSLCDSTVFCKKGWCIDSDGLCSESSKLQCSTEWSSNKPEECNEGCCDLGPNTQYREKSWCDAMGGEFDATKSRTACQYISSDVNGACVYQVGSKLMCEFTDENSCNNIEGGNFKENSLCSNSGLGTVCERQNSIDCSEGKIYWFDSCNNRENIYTGNDASSKDNSWHGGFVKPRESATCSVNLGDEGSMKTCGNCDLTTNICREVDSGVHVNEDNFVCADLGCFDESVPESDPKRYRKNGESWCVYEGRVGEYSNGDVSISSDIPGTKHYLKSCNQGKITIDGCSDFRKEICGENLVVINRSQEENYEFSQAQCRPNMGMSCIGIDNLDDCREEADCRIQKVNAADYFSFDACVPRYPQGFNPERYSEGNANDGEAVCGMASISCPVLQQYKLKSSCKVKKAVLFGRAECLLTIFTKVYLDYVANEECDKNKGKFYSQMNDFCTSLGDCAGYINSVGNYTGRSSLKERYVGLDGVSSTNNKPNYTVIESNLPSSSVVLNLINSHLERTPLCPDGEVCEETLTEEEKDLMKFRSINQVAGSIGLLAGGYGYIVAIVAAVIEAVFFQFLGAGKVGKVERSEVKFSCEPWQPPSKSEDCEKCNEGDFPCTEYKCWSLGKNCQALAEVDGITTDEVVCVKKDLDPAPPVISFNSESVNQDDFSVEVIDGGTPYERVVIKNKTDEDGCIDGNTFISFNLTTDKDKVNKFARCRWGTIPSNLNFYKDEWTDKPTSGNTWAKEHEFEMRVPDFESPCLNEDGEFNVYARCEGHNGNAQLDAYQIRMCVNPIKDITAPKIEKFEPADGSYLKFGNGTLEGLKIYTQRPVTSCKYSFDESTNYDNMIESLYCEGYGENCSLKLDYSCTFDDIFGLSTTSPTNIYFKCNDTYGNVNNVYEEYTISPSVSELKILSTKPSGYYQVSSNDVDYGVNLEVITSGGGNGRGVSECYWNYSWNEYDSSADNREHIFFDTDSVRHNQILNLIDGAYNIPIRCEDDTGNVAHGDIEFDLDIDNIAPEIAKIYSFSNSLWITTHKESRCYYNNEGVNCKVPVKNSTTLMKPGFDATIDHSVEWDYDKTYHIQCIDNLDNVGTCVSISSSLF